MIVKYLLRLGVLSFFFSIMCSSLSAQEQNGVSQTLEPQAIVTYKMPQKINSFIEQIKELTEGDDNLTEQVIYKIRQIKNSSIKRVIVDEEFDVLSSEMKKEAIKQSEVMEIIEQLKK